MKLTRKILALVAMFAVAACSGQQQQDDEDLEVSQYDDDAENADLGNDDAAEGNGQENFVDESDNQENYGDNQYAEETNSDTASDNYGGDNYGNNINATLNNGGSNELVSDDDLSNGNYGGGAGNYAQAAQPVPVATDDMTAAPMAQAPAASGGSAPIPGGRVRYVVEGGAQVMNGPGGTVILTLTQGDHPITWEENGFYKMAEGYYISPEYMSDRGVGRPNMGSRWNGGAPAGAGDYAGTTY